MAKHKPFLPGNEVITFDASNLRDLCGKTVPGVTERDEISGVEYGFRCTMDAGHAGPCYENEAARKAGGIGR